MTRAAMSPSERVMFSLIEAAANAGEVCPENGVLAARLGFASAGTASELLTALEKKGWIVVRRFATAREVEIVATGRRTLHKGSREPHWRFRETGRVSKAARIKPMPTPLIAEPDRPRVDRDPCPRCGARGDVDCGHRRSAPRWSGPSIGSSASSLA